VEANAGFHTNKYHLGFCSICWNDGSDRFEQQQQQQQQQQQVERACIDGKILRQCSACSVDII
jgi:hypothetical protein